MGWPTCGVVVPSIRHNVGARLCPGNPGLGASASNGVVVLLVGGEVAGAFGFPTTQRQGLHGAGVVTLVKRQARGELFAD